MFTTCLLVFMPKKINLISLFISASILPFNPWDFLLPKDAYCIRRFLFLTQGDAGNETRRQGWKSKGTRVHTYSAHEARFCAEACGGTAQTLSGHVTEVPELRAYRVCVVQPLGL